MSIYLSTFRPGLLAVLLLSLTGCAGQLCHLPDDFAQAFNETQLGWELRDICNNCPLERGSCCGGLACGQRLTSSDGTTCSNDGLGCEETVLIDGPRRKPVCRRPCIAVGPPPIPYEPPMPPKFLPVPVRSVFTRIYPSQQDPAEVAYGPELAFPSGAFPSGE